MPDDLWADIESRNEQIAELEAENDRLRAALSAFVDHFGPIEDNHMLNEDARNCFRLAREALSS